MHVTESKEILFYLEIFHPQHRV